LNYLLEVKVGISIACDALVSFRTNNFAHFMVDEIVKGVYMLPDKAPHSEECREKLILVFQCFDGLFQGFAA